nr:MAG TPA: hypothetical protein [Caudoviricetes sp.]
MLSSFLNKMLAGKKIGKNFQANWQKTDLHFFDFYIIYML